MFDLNYFLYIKNYYILIRLPNSILKFLFIVILIILNLIFKIELLLFYYLY